MSKSITMTNSVGITEVKEYLSALFLKTGIELAKLGCICLDPLPTTENSKEDFKCVYISLAIRVPFGSIVELNDNQEETFPEVRQC